MRADNHLVIRQLTCTHPRVMPAFASTLVVGVSTVAFALVREVVIPLTGSSISCES
jgi:hypothetical protein